MSEKERGVAQDAMFAEIAQRVSEMTVNPETERKYPPTIVQKAMKDEIHYSIQAKKNSKVQARVRKNKSYFFKSYFFNIVIF